MSAIEETTGLGNSHMRMRKSKADSSKRFALSTDRGTLYWSPLTATYILLNSAYCFATGYLSIGIFSGIAVDQGLDRRTFPVVWLSLAILLPLVSILLYPGKISEQLKFNFAASASQDADERNLGTFFHRMNHNNIEATLAHVQSILDYISSPVGTFSFSIGVSTLRRLLVHRYKELVLGQIHEVQSPPEEIRVVSEQEAKLLVEYPTSDKSTTKASESQTNAEELPASSRSRSFLSRMHDAHASDFVVPNETIERIAGGSDAARTLESSWRSCLQAWEDELNYPLPQEWTSFGDFRPLYTEEASLINSTQLQLEAFSGEVWYWYPLPEPRRPPETGKVRLEWRCGARTDDETGASGSGKPQLTLAPPARSSDASKNSNETTRSSSSKSSGSPQTPIATTPGTTTLRPPHTIKHHVLLCVRNGDDVVADTIELDTAHTDDLFFAEFKAKYLSLRGWWRHWLLPRRFAFCHVSKYEKWHVDKLGWVCNDLPRAMEYVYAPRPVDMNEPYQPPLCEHEWKHRFYRSYQTPGRMDAVTRLPKRDRRFDLMLYLSREYLWGLDVQYRISAMTVILWMMAIMAPGIFALGWLLRPSVDQNSSGNGLETAAVPVTLITGAMMLLWLPLSERFKDR